MAQDLWVRFYLNVGENVYYCVIFGVCRSCSIAMILKLVEAVARDLEKGFVAVLGEIL